MISSSTVKIGGGAAVAMGLVLAFQSGGQAQRYRLTLPGQPKIASSRPSSTGAATTTATVTARTTGKTAATLAVAATLTATAAAATSTATAAAATSAAASSAAGGSAAASLAAGVRRRPVWWRGSAAASLVAGGSVADQGGRRLRRRWTRRLWRWRTRRLRRRRARRLRRMGGGAWARRLAARSAASTANWASNRQVAPRTTVARRSSEDSPRWCVGLGVLRRQATTPGGRTTLPDRPRRGAPAAPPACRTPGPGPG